MVMELCNDCKTPNACSNYGCSDKEDTLWNLMYACRKEDIDELLKNYPNDADLGKALRKFLIKK